MKLLKLFAVTLSCTLTTFSFANTNIQSQMTTTQVANSQWVYIDVINNTSKLWYDPTSIHTVQTITKKQYQQAWFKQEIIKDLNPLDDISIGDYSLDLWRVDCTAHKVGMVKSLYYKRAGLFVSQTRVPYVYMKETIPSTAGETILNQICSGSTFPS